MGGIKPLPKERGKSLSLEPLVATQQLTQCHRAAPRQKLRCHEACAVCRERGRTYRVGARPLRRGAGRSPGGQPAPAGDAHPSWSFVVPVEPEGVRKGVNSPQHAAMREEQAAFAKNSGAGDPT